MNFTLLVIALFLATYSTRVLPAVLIGKIHFSKKVQLFLQLLPYTSMTALIFPAVLKADNRYVSVGLIGLFAAVAAAWSKLPVVICVIAAILADFLCYQLGILF